MSTTATGAVLEHIGAERPYADTRPLTISEVELELHIETRGPEHGEAVAQALRGEGYEVRVGERY